MQVLQGLLGVLVIIGLAWSVSEKRWEVRPLQIGATLLAQFVVALLLLRVPVINQGLQYLNEFVYAIQAATAKGTSFVFAYLGGDDPPYDTVGETAVIFAFQILPQVLVFSVLIAVVWHWKILPLVIKAFAWVMRRALGIGGAVGLAAAASLFVGMVEAPMVIRAYLMTLSRSEFFTVITCGMATVAGSIMAIYVAIVSPVLPDAFGHIITASIINILGAVLISRVIVPGDSITESSDLQGSLSYDSTMDAITRGTTDGVRLVVNIGAMLIVLISLVALVDYVLELIVLGGEPLSLSRMAGWLFSPIAWTMGVPWVDAQTAGALLGTKFVLNELVAFHMLSEVGGGLLTDTRVIMTYALCGFTNLGSVGILIGGVSVLVPDRRAELLSLGPKTLISGTLTACLTGTIAGIVSAF